MAADAIVRLASHAAGTAPTIGAALSQVRGFWFTLATLGLSPCVLPGMARDPIMAGAMISIILSPFVVAALDRLLAVEARRSP